MPTPVLVCQRQSPLLSLSSVLNSSCPDQAFLPIGIVQGRVADTFSGRGGVDKPALTFVDADMGDFLLGDVEENQVPGLKAGRVDPCAGLELRAGSPWHVDTSAAEGILDQAAAVEAGRCGAAVTIGNPDHLTCNGQRRLASCGGGRLFQILGQGGCRGHRCGVGLFGGSGTGYQKTQKKQSGDDYVRLSMKNPIIGLLPVSAGVNQQALFQIGGFIMLLPDV